MDNIDWEKIFLEVDFQVPDKRDASRHEVQIKVAWVHDGSQYQGVSGDLGLGGLFIATDTLLAQDVEFKLAFILPTCEEPIRAVGRVAWVRETPGEEEDEPRGFGVELLKISGDDLASVEKFLQLREALLIED